MSGKTYPLKRMLWVPPLLIAFFGAAAYFFFYRAAISPKTFTLFKVIKFSAVASGWAYWTLFAMALGFVGFGLILFFVTLQGKRAVILSENSITVPRFSLRGLDGIEIPFSTITNLERFQAGNGLFLNIQHGRGKSSLAKAAFQSESDFQEVQAALIAKTNRQPAGASR